MSSGYLGLTPISFYAFAILELAAVAVSLAVYMQRT